jgi:glycine hydroxymethyltransferase
MDPSGIRFGTPAITTRGFQEKDCAKVAELMIEVLTKRDTATVEKARKAIRKLALAHPIPDSFV